MIVDALRHFTVLNPDDFTDRIDVIGCGATGSHIAVHLLKLGLKNVHLWDVDIVETHNIANQQFHPSDLGKNKAKALKTKWGAKKAYPIKFVGHKPLSRILFICTDDMASRKDIVESNMNNPYLKLIIETRMGLWGGRVYTLKEMPRYSSDWVQWLEGWYPDEETVEVRNRTGTACQATQTLGASASIIAGVAVVQMLRWWRNTQGDSDSPEFETILGFKPLDIMTTP